MEKNLDQVSESCLAKMALEEEIKSKSFKNIEIVLIVLSSRAMVYDLEALRHKISQTYLNAVVFFQSTSGKPMGEDAPTKRDLLIDFTGPGERQGFFFAKKMRKTTRIAIGRNAGFFRKKIYDRVYDEKTSSFEIPSGYLEKERFIQKKVLHLAGVGISQSGEPLMDLGKTIALELPSMQNL